MFWDTITDHHQAVLQVRSLIFISFAFVLTASSMSVHMIFTYMEGGIATTMWRGKSMTPDEFYEIMLDEKVLHGRNLHFFFSFLVAFFAPFPRNEAYSTDYMPAPSTQRTENKWHSMIRSVGADSSSSMQPGHPGLLTGRAACRSGRTTQD